MRLKTRILKILENWTPSLGAICSLVIFLWLSPALTKDVALAVSNAFFVFFSICCGFISTSFSILLGLQEQPSIKKLKSANIFQEIIVFHIWSIIWSIFAIVCAFIVVVLGFEYALLSLHTGYLMLSIGTGALLAIARNTYFFIRALTYDKK